MIIQFSPYEFLSHVVGTTFDGAGICVVLETLDIILVPVQKRTNVYAGSSLHSLLEHGYSLGRKRG